jgi:hypothetical protein
MRRHARLAIDAHLTMTEFSGWAPQPKPTATVWLRHRVALKALGNSAAVFCDTWTSATLIKSTALGALAIARQSLRDMVFAALLPAEVSL